MQLERFQPLISTENRKLVWITLLWTAGLTSVFSNALYTRAAATFFDYGIAAGICLMAGGLIGNIGRSLAAYIVSIVSSLIILIFLASQPLNGPYLDATGVAIVQRVLLVAIFQEVFPFSIITSLAASLIGAMIGERYG